MGKQARSDEQAGRGQAIWRWIRRNVLPVVVVIGVLAPIRSVIESGVLQGKTARLYYGCKTPLQMSYQDKFKEWFTKYQVRVTPTISQPEVARLAKAGSSRGDEKERPAMAGLARSFLAALGTRPSDKPPRVV